MISECVASIIGSDDGEEKEREREREREKEERRGRGGDWYKYTYVFANRAGRCVCVNKECSVLLSALGRE